MASCAPYPQLCSIMSYNFLKWEFNYDSPRVNCMSSWTQPSTSRFSVVFLRPKANAELVPKSYVALPACYAAIPLLT